MGGIMGILVVVRGILGLSGESEGCQGVQMVV